MYSQCNNEATKFRFLNTLNQRPGKLFAITNDSTTSKAQIPYTTLTASIMNTAGVSWEIKEHILEVAVNEGCHTARHNGTQLEEALRRIGGDASSKQTSISRSLRLWI